MAQSEIEQLLTSYLTLSKAKRGTGAIVYLMLKEEDQQFEMCRFLKDNAEATDEQILAAARRIAGE